jgi:hypothetical protein
MRTRDKEKLNYVDNVTMYADTTANVMLGDDLNQRNANCSEVCPQYRI